MKTIYKSIALEAALLSVTLALQAEIQSEGQTVTTDVQASTLDRLKVTLVSPNVSGARDLVASGNATIDGNEIAVNLENLTFGTHRLVVSARFGTQIRTLYALDISVPQAELPSETQEYDDAVIVVSTYGDGAGGGADATVYAKDGDGNAHITKPLTVSGSVQEGSPYGEDIFVLNVVVLTPEQRAEVEEVTGTAYDYCNVNDAIPDGTNVTIYADEECTQKVGSTSKTEYAGASIEGDFFNLQSGESISAGTYYARIEGGTLGTNSHAEGNGTTASGYASHAEGYGATASGYASHAEGYGATASGDTSHAEGYNTTASGDTSHAEGNGTTASGDSSHAEGQTTIASGNCSHAEGDGTTASGNCSHAEGLNATASGNYSHVEGEGTTASGNCSHAEGLNATASGNYSHVEGEGTIASQRNQHVCGQYNVEDTDNSFQFIVGNGASAVSRHNAFAITRSGELALFEADGTPVILTPADLKALIASLS